MRWTDGTLHDVTRLQAPLLNLLRSNVDVIGRRQVVVVAGAQESLTAVLQDFEYTVTCNDVVEFKLVVIADVS